MAGTLVISTLSDGTNSTSSTNCIKGSAKAWVSFNGSTSPGTIRGSYNVTSVTRNAAGDYTINMTSGALADANYAVNLTGTVGGPGGIAGVNVDNYVRTTTALRLYTARFSNVAIDCIDVNASFFD